MTFLNKWLHSEYENMLFFAHFFQPKDSDLSESNNKFATSLKDKKELG